MNYEDHTDIIKGRSLIKKNNKVLVDLDIIRDNKLTILNHICVQAVKEDLNVIYPKKENSIYISPVCVHQLR